MIFHLTNLSSSGSYHRYVYPILWETAVGLASGSATGTRFVPVLVRSPSDRTPLPPVHAILRVGQQGCLARTPSHAIFKRLVLINPALSFKCCPQVKSYLRFSEIPEAGASDFADFRVTLIGKAGAVVSVGSRLWAIILGGSCEVNSYRSDRRSQWTVSDKSCTSSCLQQFKVTVILAGDMNAQVGLLSSNEVHLGVPFDFDSCRLANGKPLLAPCSNRRLVLAGTVSHLLSTHFESAVDLNGPHGY